ncbi:formate dehydrogenase accessory sulfurtransferase FdhD [Corynebacterium sp. HMSC29G08]|uniref:formate dehydrogenase accessory sulfurtransferase FdhD n=1 Tax=Corynebacterium sp. HMSC29G08 TaxID=1581069 RepID=UPI0008A42784|nr:formate dehydrogenase accessory sulfurtransferase FdhD [Corynebacterium sp. HMSC29G08]OFT82472.1 sufurtransferase FdhD [Corynebacterium sp. HMSC29G08]
MSRINRRFAVTKVTRRPKGGFVTDTRADTVTVEEPLELRTGGETVNTTMRTPGHDIELAHGWLYAEGLIKRAEDVITARYCAGSQNPEGTNTYNLLDIDLAPSAKPLTPDFIRLTPTTSACGVCGTQSISELLHRTHDPIQPIKLDPELVMSLPDRLAAHQQQFRKTGGIHAAGAFDLEGNPIVVREDIGRHNAADKVIGHLLLNNALPAHNLILVMSSRASFELVQKAAMAGFPALVAVSAASSLAVELAREANMALAGFTRGDRFNLYAGELA